MSRAAFLWPLGVSNPVEQRLPHFIAASWGFHLIGAGSKRNWKQLNSRENTKATACFLNSSFYSNSLTHFKANLQLCSVFLTFLSFKKNKVITTNENKIFPFCFLFILRKQNAYFITAINMEYLLSEKAFKCS